MNENRCKVLICSPMNIQGGISQWTRHIKEYYNAIKDASIDLEFFPMDRSEYVPEKMPLLKRTIWGIKDYFGLSRKLLRKVKINNDFSIVHLASSASISLVKDIYLLISLRNIGIKTIIHFHFGRIPQLYKSQNWEWKLITKVIALASSVIVIDKSSYDALLDAGFTNVSLLPNPLSPIVERLVDNNSKVKRLENRILFAGHVIKTKGVFELIEACKDIPDIELKLVGKVLPEVEAELRKCWGDGKGNLIITNNIPFEDVVKEMLSCSLFVLPTYTEGFPNVILESMACGCPIITTPVGAIPEMLNIGHEKECGICVKPRTIKSLKTTIVRLLEDKELANKLGENAKDRVVEQYSMEVVWKELDSIWNKILSL